MHDIVLGPLAREDLLELVADSLHCEAERAEPLAKLIHDETAGNPFFAIQFFSELTEASLLTFDYGQVQWSWDLDRIAGKGYTDNVVDLMVGKLNRLPIETQEALQILACIGSSADFSPLQMGIARRGSSANWKLARRPNALRQARGKHLRHH